jgi:hypothetical protein
MQQKTSLKTVKSVAVILERVLASTIKEWLERGLRIHCLMKVCASRSCVATDGDVNPVARCRILRSTTKSFAVTQGPTPRTIWTRCAPHATPERIAARPEQVVADRAPAQQAESSAVDLAKTVPPASRSWCGQIEILVTKPEMRIRPDRARTTLTHDTALMDPLPLTFRPNVPFFILALSCG